MSETDDLATLAALREQTALDAAEDAIRLQELAKQRSAASARIIGHSKDKGWAVEQLDGTIVQNPTLHTTGAIGKGQKVDLVLDYGKASIDFKPMGIGDCSDFSSSSATGTGTGTSTGTGAGGSNTGQSGRYWRKDPSGFCYLVSYEGPQKAGDHETERECLDSLNLKNWKCINGACGVTLPGEGQFNSQEECEEARGPWGIVNGKCEILNADQWCPAEGEKRFKSYQECRDSSIRYKCENGQCVPDIFGQYQGLEACEAELREPGFTGGQCVGVKYIVTGTITGQNTNGGTWGDGNSYTVGGFQTTGTGPVRWVQTQQGLHSNTNGNGGWYFAVGFAGGIAVDYGTLIPSAWVGNSSKPTVENIQIVVAPDSPAQEPPGGCGSPAKICPPN